MEIYKIIGKLLLEGKEQFDKDVEDTKKKGNSLATSIGKGLGVAAKVGAAAVGAAATAVGALTKASIDSYAEYEQLVGGSKLMFGDAYSYVAQKASEAYATVQMSQNDYLQQVNGFATGLKTALGGNEQAAAELAHKIIQAEADVVAATGNSQEAVQNAFNGIMKSNFTMLDNLQIGITPTKEGFQEVIDKVNEWNTANGNATKYQIDNLADCQSALIDYIEMQGLSGYAANEAAGTIQGSLSMVKASWQNLLTGLADEEADIDALIGNLATSAATAAKNIAPRVTQILNGISTMITQMAPILVDAIPVIITDVLPGMLDAGVQLIQSLLLGISENIDAVSASAVDIIMLLSNVLIENLPIIVTVGMQVLTAVITGIAQQAPELVPVILQCILLINQALISAIPQLLDAGVQLIGGLFDGLWNGLVALCPQLGGWVTTNIYEPIKEACGFLYTLGEIAVGFLWNGLCDFANKIFPGLGDMLSGHTEDAVKEAGKSMEGLSEEYANAAASASDTAARTLLDSSKKIPVDAETPVSAMAQNMQNDTSMETAATEAVERTTSSLKTAVATSGFDSAGRDAMKKFNDGIKAMESTIMATVDRIAKKAVEKIKQALDDVANYATSIESGVPAVTSVEPSVWRDGKITSGGVIAPEQMTSSKSDITIIQNIQSVPQTPVEFAAATEAYFEQARWALV